MYYLKKVMIWLIKMILWLKKVLINKFNYWLNNCMFFMDNLEDFIELQFNGRGVFDNWDGNFFLNIYRKYYYGFKMVFLLKLLKVKLYGQRMFGDFGSFNDVLNGEGFNGFGFMLI